MRRRTEHRTVGLWLGLTGVKWMRTSLSAKADSPARGRKEMQPA